MKPAAHLRQAAMGWRPVAPARRSWVARPRARYRGLGGRGHPVDQRIGMDLMGFNGISWDFMDT